MKSILFIAKTFLPATNSESIRGLFLRCQQKNIRIPEDHLPAGIYSGVVADVVNYIQPYIWEDHEARYLKLTLACTLINHETGEVEEFRADGHKGARFHIRKQDSLLLSSGCQFEVTINEHGFIAHFTPMLGGNAQMGL